MPPPPRYASPEFRALPATREARLVEHMVRTADTAAHALATSRPADAPATGDLVNTVDGPSRESGRPAHLGAGDEATHDVNDACGGADVPRADRKDHRSLDKRPMV